MKANRQHLKKLYEGKEAWNRWRDKNQNIQPQLIWAQLDHFDLSHYNLKGADLNGASLWGTNFSFVNLEDTNLQNCHADEAMFTNANLNDVQASGIQACNADFSNAIMTNWITYDGKFYDSNLSKVDFRNSDLGGCEFNNCNLEKAILEQCELSHCNFTNANLKGTSLKGSILTGCLLVDTNISDADISYSNVYGVSIWNIKTSNKTFQKDLIITKDKEPVITVDNIKVAQFIHLLLRNEEIKDIIETVTSKAVLILGRFTPERKEKLDFIKDLLRQHDYAPVVFDFDKPSNRTTLETITTIARLSKFIVADITEPKSIPQELVSIVQSMPSLKILPLINKGHKPWGMYDHIAQYPWVLPILEYDENDKLKEILLKQIKELK